MPRPVDTAKRAVLVEQAAQYLSVNGLTDTSLRDVAAALNTTSRMLVYYFGSKEALFSAVLDSHRHDFQAAFAAVQSPEELVRTLEALASDMGAGEKAPAARLLVQMLGAGASENSGYREYARVAIEEMTAALQQVLVRLGADTGGARKHASVIGAAFRGMLIDRFTSADVDVVDETAQAMFAMLVDLAVGDDSAG